MHLRPYLNHQFSESAGEVDGVQNSRVVGASESNLLENGEGIHANKRPLRQRGVGETQLSLAAMTGGGRQYFRGQDRLFTKYRDLWHRIV